MLPYNIYGKYILISISIYLPSITCITGKLIHQICWDFLGSGIKRRIAPWMKPCHYVIKITTSFKHLYRTKKC